jgi:hypothetical protein
LHGGLQGIRDRKMIIETSIAVTVLDTMLLVLQPQVQEMDY